nr:unnamed protein product [Digitaria exilis]
MALPGTAGRPPASRPSGRYPSCTAFGCGRPGLLDVDLAMGYLPSLEDINVELWYRRIDDEEEELVAAAEEGALARCEERTAWGRKEMKKRKKEKENGGTHGWERG